MKHIILTINILNFYVYQFVAKHKKIFPTYPIDITSEKIVGLLFTINCLYTFKNTVKSLSHFNNEDTHICCTIFQLRTAVKLRMATLPPIQKQGAKEQGVLRVWHNSVNWPVPGSGKFLSPRTSRLLRHNPWPAAFH